MPVPNTIGRLRQEDYSITMAASFPKTNREKADVIINAMNEIRIRLRAIDTIQAATIPDLIQNESCHLQLRLCCECLAITILAVQADFATNKAFRDDYSPVNIFKALAAASPEFFPTPSKMLSMPDGSYHFDDVGSEHPITRSEVERVWELSGHHLHRASMKKYLKRDNRVDLLTINKAKERFWNLITGLMMVLGDGSVRVFAAMHRDGDFIECAFIDLDKEAGTARIDPYTLGAAARFSR